MGVYDEGIFHSKIAGVTFTDDVTGKNRQELIEKYVYPGMELIPYIERENRATLRPAIGLWFKEKRQWHHLGYIRSELVEDLLSSIQNGLSIFIKVSEITGGTERKRTRGVNVIIEKLDVTSKEAKRYLPRLQKARAEIDKELETIDLRRRKTMIMSSGEMPKGYVAVGLVTGYASDKSTPKAYRQAIKALDNAAGGVGADAVFSVGFNSNLAVAQGCFGKSAVLEVVAWGTAAEKIKTRTRLKTDEM